MAMTQHPCATPAELLDQKYKSDEFRYAFGVVVAVKKALVEGPTAFRG